MERCLSGYSNSRRMEAPRRQAITDMIRFPAVRTRSLLLFGVLVILLGGSAGFAVWRFFAFPPDPAGAAALVVLVVDAIGLPTVLYRMGLLLAADYTLTSTGSLTLRIGLRREIIPVAEIEEIRSGSKIPSEVRKAAPGWMEGWQGIVSAEDGEAVDWIATDRGARLLLLVSKRRRIAISPADPAGFANCLTDISSQGSLEKTEPMSVRPAQILREILHTPPASAFLLGALAAVTGLGAFLTGIQPSLPADQPFRFDPAGSPASLGDPQRLLLLPAAGGAVWLVNAAIGWWAWRKEQRPAAYALWITALIVAIGLWAASVILLHSR
jgi:hypothetical protein